uniref:Uncharacterized protein n=1 Tax=Trichogramma kaykai TaxID=54128 RepID=A0ABD2XGC8_9HYME
MEWSSSSAIANGIRVCLHHASLSRSSQHGDDGHGTDVGQRAAETRSLLHQDGPRHAQMRSNSFELAGFHLHNVLTPEHQQPMRVVQYGIDDRILDVRSEKYLFFAVLRLLRNVCLRIRHLDEVQSSEEWRISSRTATLVQTSFHRWQSRWILKNPSTCFIRSSSNRQNRVFTNLSESHKNVYAFSPVYEKHRSSIRKLTLLVEFAMNNLTFKYVF